MRKLISAAAFAVFWFQSAAAVTLHLNLMDYRLGTLYGPCYCSGEGFLSKTIDISAGDTVDFGRVQIFPIQAFTRVTDPDAQPPLVYATSYVGVSFDASLAPLPPFTITYDDWPWGDVTPPTITVDLIYTIPTGASSIQLGWFGDFSYSPPTIATAVPEPSTWAMLLLGFFSICYAARGAFTRASFRTSPPSFPAGRSC